MTPAIEKRRTDDIQELVDHWFDVDPGLQRVYHFEIDSDDAHPTVLLLQVTTTTTPSPDDVLTFGFAPSKDFRFPMSVAQVTPEEWEHIQAGELQLPPGWDLDSCRKVEPSA